MKCCKRLSVFISAALLILTSAVGCSRDTSSDLVMSQTEYEEWKKNKLESEEELVQDEEALDLIGDETDINVMLWERGDNEISSTDNNKLTDWIKKQVKKSYNVNVNYILVQRSNSNAAIEELINNNEAPDIIFTYSQELFYKLADAGKLRPLNDLYDKYGSAIQEYCGAAQCGVETVEKRRYAVMGQRGTETPKHVQYIRKDWLEQLGLPVPENKKQLEDYLHKVKEAGFGTPWAMSGRKDTEKMYLNFVGSYVPLETARKAYIYSDGYIVAAPEAYEGLKQLNEWYNEGLINSDFYEDESEERYSQIVSSAKAGFILDDFTATWDDFERYYTDSSEDNCYVAVQCFDLPDGGYRNPFESKYGLFIMIPKSTSEEKAIACIKYLNWLAMPENAVRVLYTPEYKKDDLGIPVGCTKEDADKLGYPYHTEDYELVNVDFEWSNDYEKISESMYRAQNNKWATADWYKRFYEVNQIGKYRYLVYGSVPPAQLEYGAELRTGLIEFVYNCIKASTHDFDTVYYEGMDTLNKKGLKKVLDARAEYYDEVN